MGEYYPVMDGFKKAFQTMRDGQLLKWVGITTIVELGLAILGAVIAVAVTLASAGSVQAYMANKTAPLMARLIEQVFNLITAIIGLYLIPRVFRAAMMANKMKVGPQTPGVIDWAVFSIRRAVIDFLCWYDKKLAIGLVGLLIGVVLIIVTILVGANSSMALILPVLAMLFIILGLLVYLVGYTAHSTRTSFANYLYSRDNKDGAGCIRQSYGLVVGQTLEVWLAHFALIVPAIIVLIPAIIVFIVLALIPILGLLIDAVLLVVLMVVAESFIYAYSADIFAYYEKAGPAKPKKN